MSGMRLRARPLAVPFSRTIASPIYRFTHLFTLLCETEDESGATGLAALWFPSEAQAKVVLEALRYLAPIAAEYAEPSELTRALRREMNFLGYKGVTVIAMSGFEMALHDLCLRRSAGDTTRPLVDATIPAYWSGYFLNESLDVWLAEAEIAADLGFRAFKARAGRPTLAEDVHRLSRLREALPPGSSLMVDAHQAWDVETAIEASRLLEPVDIKWLEDPVIHNDYAGLSQVVDGSPIPIAAGENEYLHEGFEQLIHTGVRYVLVDLERAGGIGEWWEISEFAREHQAIVTPHLYPHVTLTLLSRLRQEEKWLEYVDWWNPLMSRAIEFVDGCAVVPDTRGTGFDPDPEAVERFALANWEVLHDARGQHVH